MVYYFDSLEVYFIALLAVLIPTIYLYFKYKYTYWSRRGITCLPTTVPFGNAKDLVLMKKCFGEMIQDIYIKTKNTGNKYGGFYLFATPNFLPVDPELIKVILTAEFRSFHDRSVFVDEDIDPLTGNLFALKGYKWRNLRTKLTPTFTSGKIKMMFETMLVVGEQLDRVLREATNNSEVIDIKDMMARFTTDIIGTVAFGIDCNSLQDPNSEFRRKGVMIFENSIMEKIRSISFLVFPSLLKILKIPVVNPVVSRFFTSVIKQTVDYREEHKVIQNDFLNLLIKLKNNENIDNDNNEYVHVHDKENKNVKPGLTLNEIAAQCFVFYVAGFETSANTMAFCLYELSVDNEIQNKLREEIQDTMKQYNDQLTYQAIMEMQYMDKVVKETLRKYPVAPFLIRECVDDFQIPGDNCYIEKGTSITISLLGLHRDPDYYPDPMKFDPERFNEKGKLNNHPYVYLPFGEGPRNCIGKRFALMQVKVGLAMLIKNYKFTLNEKTVVPFNMEPKSPILTSKEGIWLNSKTVN